VAGAGVDADGVWLGKVVPVGTGAGLAAGRIGLAAVPADPTLCVKMPPGLVIDADGTPMVAAKPSKSFKLEAPAAGAAKLICDKPPNKVLTAEVPGDVPVPGIGAGEGVVVPVTGGVAPTTVT